MNKEINEIITQLKTAMDFKDSSLPMNYLIKIEYINKLLDYIANLQQENEELKKLNENASKVCVAEHRYGVDKAEEARDYKSRCDKAIELIVRVAYGGNESYYMDKMFDLLNILQGQGSDIE